MGTRTGPLGQYQTRARDDAAAERILSAWRARLKRAASEAPNLVLSNELFFHMACDGGWQRFRQLLAEAGYAAATVVMMLRTPLVEWALSLFNQINDAEASQALLTPMQFSDFVGPHLANETLYFRRTIAGWRNAGFRVIVVGLEGARQARLDETDVLACKVLRTKCTPDGRWPYPSATDTPNRGFGSPTAASAVAAAWQQYKQQHVCVESAQLSLETMRQAAAQLANVSKASTRATCSDYGALEATKRRELEPVLQRACLLHPAPPPPPSLEYCEVDPARLASMPPPKVRAPFEACCQHGRCGTPGMTQVRQGMGKGASRFSASVPPLLATLSYFRSKVPGPVTLVKKKVEWINQMTANSFG